MALEPYDENQSPWDVKKPEGMEAILHEVQHLLKDMKDRRYFNDLPSHRVTQILNGMVDQMAAQQKEIERLRAAIKLPPAVVESSTEK